MLFDTVVSKFPVTQKNYCREKQADILNSGVHVDLHGCIFDHVVFKAILRLFSIRVLK